MVAGPVGVFRQCAGLRLRRLGRAGLVARRQSRGLVAHDPARRPSGGREGRQRDVRERRTVEIGEEGALGRAQARLEPALSVDRTFPARPEAFHQRPTLLQKADERAQPDLVRRARQHCPAAGAPAGLDDAADDSMLRIACARPETTARLTAETGLDQAILREMVLRFQGRVRADAVLGPIFEALIADWSPHLERMVAFWSSVGLMTGRYHGAPVPAHATLPVE